MSALCGAIAQAFLAACRDELEAPKPGNVHVLAPGTRKTVADFIVSAQAAAAPLTQAGARVGTRIRGAVEASVAAVPRNTNLGIILLCAPLAAAAERLPSDLRTAVARQLENLDREDACLAFRAIVLAAPGGLGTAPRHDVHEPPTVTLRAAMAEAADRDRIARQYVSDFADLFDLGEPALAAALAQSMEPKWATLAVYLAFLSSFPDSHVVREHGPAIGEEVRRRGVEFRQRLLQSGEPNALLPDLLGWDAALKGRGINPGTSADFTVATLFAHRLRSILPPARNSD
ncbi:MAG: triphosphoribosyl-dephospho-CoA synthase [Bradyrhizobiaceae bacterium]|nr:triphosphoribosyl-dephospho-CoA synthase [Hyphomicrobiales bacterium]MBV9426578.1 triphosphoribosyl-dephospho-CoA synthase [Bradyrhizobiaceae bacterium]